MGQRAAIQAELEHILASAAFRSSQRCCDFLRCVVAHTLDGAELKERTIGAEVFGRPPDYDTGADSIVRVKATELRKRLAQYYQEAGARPVHIDLPAGSYAPEFRFPVAAVSGRRGVRSFALAATAATVALALGGWWWLRQPAALDRFWQPFLETPQPVLLCVAHPVVYRINAAGEPVRDPDHYVGVGDAIALAQLSGYLSRRGKAAQTRIGADTSFSELRNAPAVLIGAYTNQWTMQVANDLRFVFDRDGGEIFIRDNITPGRRWTYRGGSTVTDYAIVTRVLHSRTGERMIAAAGLSHYGTRAAGEFLTNRDAMEHALAGAPRDWSGRNLQLILEAQVIGSTPGPPKVLAAWYW